MPYTICSGRASKPAGTRRSLTQLSPNDYLEWGTLDVDCAAVDWGVLVALPGFSHETGCGILIGELPVRERLIGYAKATKRSDHEVLFLSFIDADDYTDWTTCRVQNLPAVGDSRGRGAGNMKRRKTLSQQTLERLATLYEYAGDDPAAGDEEMGMEVATRPAAAVGDRQQAAESATASAASAASARGRPGR